MHIHPRIVGAVAAADAKVCRPNAGRLTGAHADAVQPPRIEWEGIFVNQPRLTVADAQELATTDATALDGKLTATALVDPPCRDVVVWILKVVMERFGALDAFDAIV